MLPDEAVSRLAEVVVSRTEFTEDDIYAAMAAAGIPDPVADRAYKFTQIAWGRMLLDGLGVQFSPEYVCFKGDGTVIESGLLGFQPYFVAATLVAARHARSSGFQRLALMAAEVQVVNDLLNKGSKPENIATSIAAMFMEPPTPAGINKATEHLHRKLGNQN